MQFQGSKVDRGVRLLTSVGAEAQWRAGTRPAARSGSWWGHAAVSPSPDWSTEGARRARRDVQRGRRDGCRTGAACSDALVDTPSSSARSTHGGLIRLTFRAIVRIAVRLGLV